MQTHRLTFFWNLSTAILLGLASTASASEAHAARTEEIGLRSSVLLAPEPLTTERAWSIPSHELNPHRVRWLLERRLKLVGLTPTKISGQNRYRVQVDALEATGLMHVRGPGPWYQDFSKFACDPEPNSWFATREGATEAVRAAADYWVSILEDRKLKLSLLLERVSAISADEAMREAEARFEAWRTEVDNEWAVKGRNEGRMAEWRSYLQMASRLGPESPCQARHADRGKNRTVATPPPWREMMEPPSPEPNQKLLAVAPARRWSGVYTVRVSVIFGDKTLNGQFMVDSGAATSIVSPQWLLRQGMNPALLAVPGAALVRVSWSGGTGFAKRALALKVTMGGTPLPISEFLLMDAALFGPPAHPASCCDGILGQDFLRLFAVQFRTVTPFEVRLFDRQGYSEGSGTPWVEVATAPNGETVSTGCSTAPGAGPSIAGARWDTGDEVALDIHQPWQKAFSSSRKQPWEIFCGTQKIADGVHAVFPKFGSGNSEGDPFKAKVPGFTGGMELLGRGNFTFDLGHGRLWFEPRALKAPVPENRSGLRLKYFLNEDEDRELRVTEILPGTPADALKQAGLRKGQKILSLDSRSIDEMDQWEVDQRLAGVYGPETVLAWNIASASGKKKDISTKLVPLKLK